MRIYKTKKFLQKRLKLLKSNKKIIGFVPTMGALHQGHLSLVKAAQKQCDIVIVSIFVNPTQFDRKEDLDNYPSTIEQDTRLLKQVGCDMVFIPNIKEMYAQNITAKDYDFDGLDKVMEGAHRQGHFDGVGTIVKKLFDIVQPDYAFFGEKDFQQLQIIKKLVEIHRLPLKIIGVPIYREDDGLAMSSRNVRLTPENRQAAPFIYQTLQGAQQLFKTQKPKEVINWVYEQFAQHPLLKLEYFSIADESNLLPLETKEKGHKYRGFIAVFAGNIRLIDNIALN